MEQDFASQSPELASIRRRHAELWRHGERLPIEALLADGTRQLQEGQLLELIYAEILLREQLSERCSFDEYQRRFPNLAEALRRLFDLHEVFGGSFFEANGGEKNPEGLGQNPIATASESDGQLSRSLLAIRSELRSAQQRNPAYARMYCSKCDTICDCAASEETVSTRCPECGADLSPVTETGTVIENGPPLRRVAHFQLIRKLGHGTFGEVWEAFDEVLERPVALKIPRASRNAGSDRNRLLRDFLHEARAAAKLKHEHIVRVFEVSDGDEAYIASELIDGPNLRDWLKGWNLTLHTASELVWKIANALSHAHEAGIIHRDLKPENILIGADGQPRVADFGLARSLPAGYSISVEGQLLGSPAYMPPEQARGESNRADARSDLYSLGVIWFELITGQRPFQGDWQMILYWKQRAEAPPVRQFNPRAPLDVEVLCRRCLERDPIHRFATAREFADELRRFLDGRPIHSRPLNRTETIWRWCLQNHRWVFPTVTSLMTILIGGGISLALLAAAAKRERELRIASENSAARERITAEAERKASADARQRLQDAREAVDLWLTGVSSGLKEGDDPESLRQQLLEKAADSYEKFSAQTPRDPELILEQGRTFLRLAQLRFELAELDRSAFAAQRAIDVMAVPINGATASSELKRRHSWAMAQALLALVRRDQGQTDAAAQAYEHAVRELSSLREADPGEPAYREAIITTRVNHAARLTPTSASPLLAQAVEDAENLRLHKPHEFVPVVLLSRTRLEYASILARLGKFVEARQQFGHAQELIQSEHKKKPDDRVLRELLTLAGQMEGELAYKLGEWLPAIESLRISSNDYSQLANDAFVTAQIRTDSAMAFVNLSGRCWTLGFGQEAAEAIRLALQILEEQHSFRGSRPEDQELFAAARDVSGRIALGRGERESAEQDFREALQLLEILIDANPDNPRYRERWAACRGHVAELLFENDAETARREFQLAAEILKGLHSESKDLQSSSELSSWETAARLFAAWSHCETLWGDRDAAKRLLNEAKSLWQARLQMAATPEACHALSWLLASSMISSVGDLTLAEEAARRALETAPQNRWFLATAGVVQFRQGKFADAKTTLQAAIDGPAESSRKEIHPNYLFFLSMAEASLNQTGEYERSLQEARRRVDREFQRTAETRQIEQSAMSLSGVGPKN